MQPEKLANSAGYGHLQAHTHVLSFTLMRGKDIVGITNLSDVNFVQRQTPQEFV